MKKRTVTLFSLLLLASILQVSAYEFCDDGIVGEKELRIISVDDMLKDNGAEWIWQNTDTVEVEIRVENKEDESKNYKLELVFVKDDDEEDVAKDEDDLIKEFTLSGEERKSISMIFKLDEDVDVDEYELYVKFYEEGEEESRCVENSDETIIIEKLQICEEDEVDKDELEIEEITDNKIENEVEWEWTPGNEVHVSVEVENKDYETSEFQIELIFFDEERNEVQFAKDPEDQIRIVQIDEDDNQQSTLSFDLRTDLEEGDYDLYAKVFKEDDEEICTSLRAQDKDDPVKITIEKPKRKVILEEASGPQTVSTGSIVEYSTKVTNLGSKDEDRILIMAYNSKMDLKQERIIHDLESGQSEEVTFSFTVSQNLNETEEDILFTADYSYDEDKDIYSKNSGNDGDILYTIQIIKEEIVEEVSSTSTETPVENETIIEENNTIIETKEINNTETNTIITGAVTNPSGSSFGSITAIGIILILVAGVGLFVYKKKGKSKDKSSEYIEYPMRTRKYTASLE